MRLAFTTPTVGISKVLGVCRKLITALLLWTRLFIPIYPCTSVSRSTIGRGQRCHNFVPVLGGDGTKIAPPEDIFDQPPDEIS